MWMVLAREVESKSSGRELGGRSEGLGDETFVAGQTGRRGALGAGATVEYL